MNLSNPKNTKNSKTKTDKVYFLKRKAVFSKKDSSHIYYFCTYLKIVCVRSGPTETTLIGVSNFPSK